MSTSVAVPPAGPDEQGGGGNTQTSRQLCAAIEQAAHLPPAQGPITAFIHHNTLHSFEGRPLGETVKEGPEVLGCQPDLREDRYHDERRRGRIRVADAQTALREDLRPQADDPGEAIVNEQNHAE